MIGGGKYEKEVEQLILNEEAEMAVILVAGGKRGSGFSVGILPSSMCKAHIIVEALRMAANSLEKDLKEYNAQPTQ